VVGRSISKIPSIPADDQCYVCVAQSRQLVSLLYQVRFPSSELLIFCFGCVGHIVKLMVQSGSRGVNEVD